MNREEFERVGWVFESEYFGEQKFTRGDIWEDNGQGTFLSVTNGRIIITTTDKGFNQDGPNYSVKYNGKCNSMEQFHMICEMIELKA